MQEEQEKWPQDLAEVAQKLDAWAQQPNLSDKAVFSVCRVQLPPIVHDLEVALTWLKWDAPSLADDVLALLNLLDEFNLAGQPGFAALTEDSGLRAMLIAFQLVEKLRRIAEVATRKRAGGGERGIAGYMSSADLAKHHGVDREALRKRLDRYRGKHIFDSELFVESQDRGKNKPKYLYDAEKVLPIIQELKKQGASVKRPSKRK